jgi:hypothetical protein
MASYTRKQQITIRNWLICSLSFSLSWLNGETEAKLQPLRYVFSRRRRVSHCADLQCVASFASEELQRCVHLFLRKQHSYKIPLLVQLAAHKNPWGVTLGATLGHTVCTSLAVVGGRLLALKISQRTVATVGGCLFMVFAMSSYFYPPV